MQALAWIVTQLGHMTKLCRQLYLHHGHLGLVSDFVRIRIQYAESLLHFLHEPAFCMMARLWSDHIFLLEQVQSFTAYLAYSRAFVWVAVSWLYAIAVLMFNASDRILGGWDEVNVQ